MPGGDFSINIDRYKFNWPRKTPQDRHVDVVTGVLEKVVWFGLFDLRPCQRDNGYLDGRSQIKVHTDDERTQVHSAQSSLAVTHPGTNRARRSLTSVTESPS